MPCDRGSPREVLEGEFPDLDFSRLEDDWTNKKGLYAADEASLQRRATKVRQWLQARPEREIIVVSHGSFLRQAVPPCTVVMLTALV
jgi:broad specificity phosphatase PhoE